MGVLSHAIVRTPFFKHSSPFISPLYALLSKRTLFSVGSSQTMVPPSDIQGTQARLRQDATAIFKQAVHTVLPKQMVSNTLRVTDGVLNVDGHLYQVDRNVYVVGIGKASLGMLNAVEEKLGKHIVRGVASVPKGIQDSLKENGKENLLLKENSVVEVIEGAYHNLPDQESFRASSEIFKMVQTLKQGDILIACITGGGSTLLSYPVPPISIDDLVTITKLIASQGGDITVLNLVRQNLELLKAGGLARAAQPAQVLALLLSDIIGDPLNMIASGPTVDCNTSAKQCLDIFDQFKVHDKVPQSVLKYLEEKVALDKQRNESERTTGTSVVSNSDFDDYVHNVLVGSNKVAIQGAMNEAIERGYMPFILSTEQDGEAKKVAASFAEIASFICLEFENGGCNGVNAELVKKEFELISMGVSKDYINMISCSVQQAINEGKPLCMISGGETVVKVKGRGMGGRNTEFALAAAIKMKHSREKDDLPLDFGVQILSAGTDGQDGACSAAGALADSFLVDQGESMGLNAKAFLEDNDSYSYYRQVDGGEHLVVTGLTGTNVMDLHLLLVQPRSHTKVGSRL